METRAATSRATPRKHLGLIPLPRTAPTIYYCSYCSFLETTERSVLLLRSPLLLYSAFCSILSYFGIRSRTLQNESISDYRSLVLRSLLGWTSVVSFQFVGGLPRKAALDTDMPPHSLATYATSALGPVTTIRSYRHRSYSLRLLSLVFNLSASPVDSLKYSNILLLGPAFSSPILPVAVSTWRSVRHS